MSTEDGTIVQYDTAEWQIVNENLATLKGSLDSLASELQTIVKDKMMEVGISIESATGKELMASFDTNVVSEINNFSTEIGNFVTKSTSDESVATDASQKAVAAARG